MIEYFGKRGMSVSVEVFISKALGSHLKLVYLVALDRCDQDALETLCIADVVAEQFKKDSPHTKQLWLKSDNAGKTFPTFRSTILIKFHHNYRQRMLPREWCS